MMSATRRIRPHRLAYPKSESFSMILWACIGLLGVLLGSIWEGWARLSQNQYAGYFVSQYLERYQATTSFGALLGSIVWPALLPLFFLVYNGFNCVGIPFIFMVPLLKGFSIGNISGYLYSTQGLHGMATVLVLFFLPEIVQLWAVLLLSQSTAHASLGLLLHHFTGQATNADDRLARTLRLFAKSLLLTLAACLLESALTVVFAPVLLN